MRVTVTELPHEPWALEAAWADLCRHTASEQSELVLLPELAFVEAVWERPQADPERLAEIEKLSEQWLRRLSELGALLSSALARADSEPIPSSKLFCGRIPTARRRSAMQTLPTRRPRFLGGSLVRKRQG
jgi:hypothetical protein